MLLGFAGVLLAFVLVYRSCIAGLIEEGSGIGWLGLIPAALYLTGGLLAVQFKRRTGPLAFLIPAGVFFLADVSCMVHAGKGREWMIWGLTACSVSFVFLVMLCMHRQRDLAVPVVFLVLTVAVTAGMWFFLGRGDAAGADETAGQGAESAGEDGGTAPALEEEGGTDGSAGEGGGKTAALPQPDTEDGVLNLTTEKFTLKYARHELGQDVNGNSCLYVYYDFTNHTAEPMSIPSVSYTKLLQNDTECGKASVAETNAEMDNYKGEVAPGATVTACEVYALTDMSEAELQAVEFVPTNARMDLQKLPLA